MWSVLRGPVWLLVWGEDYGYMLPLLSSCRPSFSQQTQPYWMKIQSCPPLLQPANGFAIAPEHNPIPFPDSQDLLPNRTPNMAPLAHYPQLPAFFMLFQGLYIYCFPPKYSALEVFLAGSLWSFQTFILNQDFLMIKRIFENCYMSLEK